MSGPGLRDQHYQAKGKEKGRTKETKHRKKMNKKVSTREEETHTHRTGGKRRAKRNVDPGRRRETQRKVQKNKDSHHPCKQGLTPL